MDSPRKSKDATPKTRKRKLDRLQQKGSMIKYCSSSSSQSSPVIAAKKSSKPRKVISADSDEEHLIEDYCEPLPKDKKKQSCAEKSSWKPNSNEQAKCMSSPIKVLSRNNSKQDSDYSPSSTTSLKAKKRVVACPNSPMLEDMDLFPLPAKKRKSDDSVMESKSSKLKDKKFDLSLAKPKLRVRDNDSKNITPIKKRDVITCPDSPCTNSSSGSSFGSTKSQKEKLELELFGESPEKKIRTSERELRSKEAKKKPKIECPELPKFSSRYHEFIGTSKSKETISEKLQRTPTKSASSSSGSSKVLVIPDSPVIVEARSKKLKKEKKEEPEPPKPSTSQEVAVTVLNVTSPTAISKPIIRRSQKDIEEKDLLSVTSSSSKVGKGSTTILPEETRLAATLAFGQNYDSLLTAVEMHSPSQICPDFEWALSNRRCVLDSSFDRNFTFHTRFNQDAEAVRLLRLRVGRHSYPNARIVHEILDKIIPNVKNRVALHRSLNLLYHILMLHPSGADNGNMRQYYWSFMSQRFDDKDPSSRWEHLRTMLNALLDEPWNSGERQPAPSVSEAKSHVVAYLIRILSDDLKCWISTIKQQPADLLRERKDVPLVARLLWPNDGSTIGHFNNNCRDLIKLHLQAVEKKSRNALAHTKELVRMMASVTQLCDVQVPLKMRRVGERMSHLGREMANLVLDVYGRPTASSMTYRDVLKSVACSQLRFWLSTSLLNRLDSSVPILEGQRLTLSSMLQSYLIDPSLPSSPDSPRISRDKAMLSVNRFRTKPAAYRWCTVVALSAYMRMFCTAKTWFFIRDKRRYPASKMRNLMPPPGSERGRGSADIFSTSFAFQSLMEDLKAAKLLLHSNRESKSLYSLISV